jgi:hypothetical protein
MFLQHFLPTPQLFCAADAIALHSVRDGDAMLHYQSHLLMWSDQCDSDLEWRRVSLQHQRVETPGSDVHNACKPDCFGGTRNCRTTASQTFSVC